tara:strand:- start:1800 stop:2348 length:549 start_codon:yes stop_codon:yes gene_type:complete
VFPSKKRIQSRRDRYDKKQATSIQLPVAVATISFDHDDNLAFLIRSAACFGIPDVFVIGKLPERSFLNSKSGSLYDYVNIKSFSNMLAFTEYARKNDYKIVAAEICYNAKNIYEYKFSFDQKTILLLGNETSGVPGDITLTNDTVYIPMPGPGYCLNVSQAGTVVMSEYYKQYRNTEEIVDY